MGISTSGGMYLGAEASDIEFDEDKYEDIHDFAEEHEMEIASPWYDSAPKEGFIGYKLPDLPMTDMSYNWFINIKRQAEQFKTLTNTPAYLVGRQHVT